MEQIPVASISFISPDPMVNYSAADSILIRGTAVSTEDIHGYDLVIRKANDTTTYYFTHVHDHGDNLSIETKWKSPFNGPADMEATIVLYLDHEGHTYTRKAGFSIQ